MMCLSLDREGTELRVVETYVGWWFLDTMIEQYLLALGEFGDFDKNFAGSQNRLCYTFFVLSTFFTCVTALNMIIAIMSATFDQVNDEKELHEFEMKVSLLSDYVSLIDKEKKVKAKKQAITFKKQAKTFEKEVKTFLVIVTNTEHASEVD